MKTLTSLILVAFVTLMTAETLDTMLIHKTDGSILKIALTDIDSTTFERTTIIETPSGFAALDALPGDSLTQYYEVEAISKDVAYLVTNKNMLFKTTDGGQNWTNISPEWPTSFNISGNTPQVSFFNENIGALAFSADDGANGYNTTTTIGYVWCTTDGGQNWSQRFDVNDDQILHLQQVNETITYISGTSHLGVSTNRWFKKISRNTSTGAFTLSNLSSPPSSLPHTIAGDWHDATTGVMVFKNNTHYLAQPYMTSNGGSSWSSINGNLPSVSNPYTSICGRSIKMIDENSFVYVLTYNGGSPVKMWRTDNGGATWTEGTFNKTPTGRLTAVDFADDGLNGFVAGYDSTNYYFVTTDGGFNWTQEDIAPKKSNQNIYCVDYAQDGSIWVSGSYQGLWRKQNE